MNKLIIMLIIVGIYFLLTPEQKNNINEGISDAFQRLKEIIQNINVSQEGKNYLGRPPCQTDENCFVFNETARCDLSKGECYV